MQTPLRFFARATLLFAAVATTVRAAPTDELFASPTPIRLIRAEPPLEGSPVGDPTHLFPSLPSRGGESPIAPHERAPLSADVTALVAGNNGFALKMFQRLTAQGKADDNLLVSPFSISTALGMTYAGARGRTAQQMADVLGYSLPDDRLRAAFGELMRDLGDDREGYEFNVANRLFGQSGYPFKQPFLDVTSRDYGAPLEQVDYKSDHESARLRINDWVEDQTNDKIRNLLPADVVKKNTRLILTNAVYFNGAWKYEFDKRITQEEVFYQTGSTLSQAPMMRQQRSFQYAELPGFQMLEMPYAGDDLSLVAMLPTERDGLANLEAALTPEMLDAGFAALHNTLVNVSLPKFTFNSSFKLADPLKTMGMTDAFDEAAADLTGIADPPGEKLYISDALHKAFIAVNEEGTEAAAATAIVFGAISTCFCPSPQPKEFRADHPFLFALRDRHSGSLLFLGRVAQPSELVTTLAVAAPEPASFALAIVSAILLSGFRRRSS